MSATYEALQRVERLETQSEELMLALQQILEIAEKSDFKAISLLKLREIAGPAIKKAEA